MTRPALRWVRRRPVLAALGASLGLSGVSIVLARALSYDAWGWLLWGQEIVHGRPFTTDGYPTWKPLTGVISVLLSPLGDAAPVLWLLTARTAAVMALWLVFRLASRLAGPVAGTLAVLAMLIVPQWLFQTGVGGSEPLVTALLLGAVLRHAERDHLGGFVLVLLAALLRPEAWPFLAASAIMAWRRGGRGRALVVLGLAVVPLLWFGGEYLGSGDPFRGSQLAKTTQEAVRLRRRWGLPAAGVIDIGWRMLPLPLLLCVPVALVSAVRRRDAVAVMLGMGGVVWLSEVAVLAQLGYAGVTRFLFPSAAGLAVVGAAGLLQLMRATPGARRVRAALVAAVVALALPSVPHALGLGEEVRHVEERADLNSAVDAIVRGVGRAFLLAAPHLAAQGETITPLAWRLDVGARTLQRPRVPGLVLVDRNQHWRLFSRALRRARGRYRLLTVRRAWALRLISAQSSFRRPSGRTPNH